MVPLIDAFQEIYPETSVDLRITNRRVDLVTEGIDLAIRIGTMQDSTLVASSYFMARAGLWASQDYLDRNGVPQTTNDLAHQRIVNISRAADLMTLRNQDGKSVPLPDKYRLSCEDMQPARAFVETGAGIGLLPDFIGNYP